MEKYYNNLIHEYLDGGLEAGEEERLFIALSGDDELRREFDKLLKISMVSGSSYSFEAPPIETSNKIFSELGFSIPAGEPSSATKKLTGIAALTALLWKAAPFAAVAILAGAVSIGAFKYLQTNDASLAAASGKPAATNNLSNAGDRQDLSINNSNSLNGAFPQMSSFEDQTSRANGRNRGAAANNPRYYKTFATREELEAFMKENSITAQTDLSDGGAVAILNDNSANRTIQEIEYSKDPRVTNNFRIVNVSSSARSGNMGMVPAPQGFITNLNVGLFESGKLGLGFRKLVTDRSNLELLRNPNAFNNYSGAIYYKLSEDFELGAVLSRENFPQSFVAPSGNKQTQNPTLITYAVEGRYYPQFLKIADIVTPYGALAMGGSSMGPIVKYEAGIAFAPTDIFEIALGWQSGYLFYNVSGTNYNSNKNGFVWGVRVNF